MGLFNIEDKFLKRTRKQAEISERLRPEFVAMSDEQLKAKTVEYRERAKNGESLEELLPEVFAQVREASRRVLAMEHFFVQLIGGGVLHYGDIAEMKTGEGKTLVATLPACLNALTGSVHIVTVNEYLAKRDSEWMGKLYGFLGYSVGLILKDMSHEEKQAAYACDIIYATNNELGFDYLRDHMVVRSEALVQGELNYAIIDEVDSILIDEARTPLIISGAGDKSTQMYNRADKFVRKLALDTHFTMDEKAKTINLLDEGMRVAEKNFGVDNLSDIENTELNHHINQALRANYLMKRDIDYVVQHGEVIIVDEFTGRLMTGRRYSEGLHQAIEAKEGVEVARESKTLATITFQNFFRMYKKLSGMTGTAKTEESEFKGIYNLGVVEIPTNMPMVRKDENDVVLSSVRGKFEEVVAEIVRAHQTGQPILVGTVSVENSEILSNMLSKTGVKHEVLNAKHHEKEALIVAQAGKFGQVTIATNMAGRGTDILLGGNPDFMARSEMRRMEIDDELINQATSHAATDDPEILHAREIFSELFAKHKKITDTEHEQVVAAGGLYIIGTERHESRRIDNQLRGRSGRQGDPGSSRFYISLSDDLMRLFGGERIKGLLERIGGGEEVVMEMGLLSNQIEKAQKRIEGRNFEIRQNVLKYDDVMNKQRELIYSQRTQVLHGEDLKDNILAMIDDKVVEICNLFCPDTSYPEEWDITALGRNLSEVMPISLPLFRDTDITKLTNKQAHEYILNRAHELYEKQEKTLADAGLSMREAERIVLLNNVDDKWMDHIDNMDQLRQGIGLRAYGNVDPVVAFRKESFDMFEQMVESISLDTVKMLYHIKVESKLARKEVKETGASLEDGEQKPKATVRKTDKKVGRNDPCPCGSGKKYKNCCGKNNADG